jgi:uncharacterized repeat protein (TIGR03803 family)
MPRGKNMKVMAFAKTACTIALLCVATAIASAQTFTTLLSFDGTDGNGGNSFAQGLDGNLYGGGGGGGAFFKMTSAGKLTTLYTFCIFTQAICPNGSGPSDVILGADGNFYGVTTYGGSYTAPDCNVANTGCGTVFKITPTGKLTTLYTFCTQSGCPDGETPTSALVPGTDGNFYGTTSYGGTNGGGGTVFKITPTGELTTLYSFNYPTSPDGYDLSSGVAFGTNANLFGAANFGGTYGEGTLFELTLAGNLTVLYDFDISKFLNGAHVNGFTLASNGSLYGTTAGSGSSACPAGCGTILKVTEAGKVSRFYTFCSQTNCADGSAPFAPVIQATDGNLYGTTTEDGCYFCFGGTLYQITLAGKLTTLYSFCSQSGCPDGKQPYAPLMQATNGSFYGTTSAGGTSQNCGTNVGCGTAFSLSMGLAPFVEANPNFGKAGALVNILGNNLTGTTSVTFNGTSAKFKVISGTYLKAQVPTGATTGPIQITTTSSTLNSNVAFQVLP